MGRFFRYLWASPNTALGLLICGLAALDGATVRVHDGTIEAHGGAIGKILRCRILRAQAVTLGHVILARGPASLDTLRSHERVHVHQYEVLGPFFLPAYFVASLVALLAGKHFYRDNYFEIQARRFS